MAELEAQIAAWSPVVHLERLRARTSELEAICRRPVATLRDERAKRHDVAMIASVVVSHARAIAELAHRASTEFDLKPSPLDLMAPDGEPIHTENK